MNKTTYTIEITMPSSLKAFTTFLNGNPSIKVINVLEESSTQNYSTKYCYVPTREFVALCGPENLTSGGLISEQGAIDVIVSYAKTFKLYYKDYIELDEYLQNLLGIKEQSTLTIHSLSKTLRGLFTIVKA